MCVDKHERTGSIFLFLSIFPVTTVPWAISLRGLPSPFASFSLSSFCSSHKNREIEQTPSTVAFEMSFQLRSLPSLHP